MQETYRADGGEGSTNGRHIQRGLHLLPVRPPLVHSRISLAHVPHLIFSQPLWLEMIAFADRNQGIKATRAMTALFAFPTWAGLVLSRAGSHPTFWCAVGASSRWLGRTPTPGSLDSQLDGRTLRNALMSRLTTGEEGRRWGWRHSRVRGSKVLDGACLVTR